jgi:hypothetical protein
MQRYHHINCSCSECAKKRKNEQILQEILESRNRRILIEQKKELDKIDAREAGGIVGNQRWNPKKKRWESLGKPKFMSLGNGWSILFYITVLVALYIVISYIISRYSPNTTWHIFIW